MSCIMLCMEMLAVQVRACNCTAMHGCCKEAEETTASTAIRAWAAPCRLYLLRSPSCSSSKQSVALLTCSSMAPSTKTPPAFSLSARSPCTGFKRSCMMPHIAAVALWQAHHSWHISLLPSLLTSGAMCTDLSAWPGCLRCCSLDLRYVESQVCKRCMLERTGPVC